MPLDGIKSTFPVSSVDGPLFHTTVRMVGSLTWASIDIIVIFMRKLNLVVPSLEKNFAIIIFLNKIMIPSYIIHYNY